MKKSLGIFLLASLFAMPVFADNVFMNNTTSETNMCVVSVTGQSQSNSAALPTATWSPVTYNCAAGTYLPADGVACATCPAGYYCDGGDYEYNELNATGLNACPSARPSSHAGATSQNACYTPCPSDKIDAGLDGTNCQTPKFTVTTTNLSANTEFKFYMSASGTFYVDCGSGGTLSGTGVSNNTITRNNTTEALYTCTYATGGTKTIKMSGLATGYNQSPSSPAIRFFSGEINYTSNGTLSYGTEIYIASINGSIGAIFPTLSNAQPSFYRTFFHLTNVTGSIPENLFSGVYGALRDMMFYTTFNLSSFSGMVPKSLFNNMTGAGAWAFGYTFSSSNISSIEPGLFDGITVVGSYMFYSTFANCTSLTSIPDGLFYNITSAYDNTFQQTFLGCTNLSGYIPKNLFRTGLTDTNLMTNIFYNTGSLATSCPAGTVQYITGYEDYWSGHVSCVDANLTCSAGNYLPAHGYECATCLANNYCPGGTLAYSASSASGINACDTGYSSAAGSDEANDCYRACTTSDVAHATSVSGNVYANGTNTCVPASSSSCETGYSYVSMSGGTSAYCTPSIYNINYVLNGGSSLPSTYTQIEYLESTGTQYIDTGIGNWNETLEFEIKLSIQQQESGIHTYFGGWNSWSTNGHGIPGVSTHTSYRVGTRFVAGWTSEDGADIGISVGQTGVYSLKGDTVSWSLGTSAPFDRGSAFTMTDTNIFLFACNRYAGEEVGEYSKFKMYYMKIWLNNAMVRDFIPARRNSDGELGMYDTVTNTFFTNLGTGTFIAGPDMDKYTYSVGATIDSVPTRTHSSFAGWCTDAGLTNCAATQTIGTTATGDKTFYAKYLCDTGYSTNVSNTACNANTITVNWDDGNGGYISNTCTYGGDLTTPSTAPTKRGHIFTGWSFNLN